MDGNKGPDGKGAGKIGIGGTKCKKQFCRVCICLSYDCFVLLFINYDSVYTQCYASGSWWVLAQAWKDSLFAFAKCHCFDRMALFDTLVIRTVSFDGTLTAL